MDEDKIQSLFEDKYEEVLGMSYRDWMEQGPQNQEEAFQRCMEIDKELENTYDQWFEAQGEEKEQLETYRQKLKAEYDLMEAAFNLEEADRNN